jgi:hypothetical protein
MKKFRQFVEDTFAAPVAANATGAAVANFDPMLGKKKKKSTILSRQVSGLGKVRPGRKVL